MPQALATSTMVLLSAIVLFPHTIRAEENAESSSATTNRQRREQGRNHFEIGLHGGHS